MIYSSRKSAPAAVPTAVIRKTLSGVLPGKSTFRISVANSGLGHLKVVRVITDAWKSKPVVERLERVVTAVRPVLTREQNDAILRFSILTPKEWAGIRQPRPGAARKSASRKVGAS
jgi:hypothetical protein